MSATERPPRPAVWPMYRAMVGVGLLCGVLIVTAYELTGPMIAHNRAVALEAAIFEVVPGATSRQTFVVTDDGGLVPLSETAKGETVAASAETVHAVYGTRGELLGVAIEGRGMGYQDTIALIYGVDLDQQAIIGLRVLDSRETPGLGDRIETEPHFLASFEKLDVRLDPDGTAPAHPIEVVAQGQKVEPWQIDGITGATISSKAVGSILRESTARWMPRLMAGRMDLTAGTDGEDTP